MFRDTPIRIGSIISAITDRSKNHINHRSEGIYKMTVFCAFSLMQVTRSGSTCSSIQNIQLSRKKWLLCNSKPRNLLKKPKQKLTAKTRKRRVLAETDIGRILCLFKPTFYGLPKPRGTMLSPF